MGKGRKREGGKREWKGRGHGHGSERAAGGAGRCGAVPVRARALRRVGDFGRVGFRFLTPLIAVTEPTPRLKKMENASLLGENASLPPK